MERAGLVVPPGIMVGKIAFTMQVAEDAGTESYERWDRRAEALAAWLLAEWRREQQEEAA